MATKAKSATQIKKETMVKLICANCGSGFERSQYNIDRNNTRGNSGAEHPCCSKSCSGSFGRKIGATPDIDASRAFRDYVDGN